MGFEDYFRLYLNTLIWALSLALIFYLPERLAPAEKAQPAVKRVVNLIYTPILIASIFLLHQLFSPLVSIALVSTGGGLLSGIQPSGFMGQLVFAIAFAVVWDVWQYWAHRLQHTSAFLWETHKFHHTETALNATSQARHHPLNYIVMLFAYLPVIMVFGPQQPHFVATFLMFKLWGFVNHANLRLTFGPLTPLIASPQWHRIHHSIHAEHCNRNFATFFPFVDMLFGTYYSPRKGEYPPTGLASGAQTSDLRDATVAPLGAWNKMVRVRLRKFGMVRREGL